MEIIIKSALLSVFDKTGIVELGKALYQHGVTLYATGGTAQILQQAGLKVTDVADLTGYPSILGGRVKTLHPAVFGGILARRDQMPDITELGAYRLPMIDLVVVDLYPFGQTLHAGGNEADLIEKIDIGGVSLIRAAAKNFNFVTTLTHPSQYPLVMDGKSDLNLRKALAAAAFRLVQNYDTDISDYFNRQLGQLRYGENPHQSARFNGNLDQVFEQLAGKPLSYNNLLDAEAALRLNEDWNSTKPLAAIFKHTNTCGLATDVNLCSAWQKALACDPVSAFGGFVLFNQPLDLQTAQDLDKLFFEAVLAPDFAPEALDLLTRKPNRIILRTLSYPLPATLRKTALNGELIQTADVGLTDPSHYNVIGDNQLVEANLETLQFGELAAKHLKSNAIAIVKQGAMIGSGTGQTSRLDSFNLAIEKAKRFGFSPVGAVLASDGFFPFDDIVQLAHQAGINLILQPGGSIRDNDSINFCKANGLTMVLTGVRHFKH